MQLAGGLTAVAQDPLLAPAVLNALESFAKQTDPRPLLAWAEEERIIAGASPAPGPFRADYMPPCREILEAYSQDGVEEITILCATQMLKTETMLNVLLYHVVEDPAPTLLVIPDETLARQIVKKRVDTASAAMPDIEERMHNRKVAGRRRPQALLQRDYPPGSLDVVSSGAKTGTDSRTIRVALVDEVDKIKDAAIREKIRERCRRYLHTGRGRIIFASVPGDADTSVIWRLYKESSRGEWHSLCPHCGDLDTMKWERVVWETDKLGLPIPETAKYHCGHCGSAWTEEDRVKGVREGRFLHADPTQTRRLSFWVNRLADIHIPLTDIVAGARDALRRIKEATDYEPYRTWWTSTLAEPWYEDRKALKPDDIADRLLRPVFFETGDRRIQLIHDDTEVVTAAVDVQGDRLEVDIGAWGWHPAFQTIRYWGLGYHIIDQNPTEWGAWERLDALILQSYATETPPRRPFNGVNICVIDARGQHLSAVQAYVNSRRSTADGRIPWHVYPIVGVSVTAKGGGIHVPKHPPDDWGGAVRPQINTNAQKDWLYSQLKADAARDAGDRVLQWYSDAGYNFEYFKQLVSERKRIRTEWGQDVYRWEKVQQGRRNEALDTMVYGKGAMEFHLYRLALASGTSEAEAYKWQELVKGLHLSHRTRLAQGANETPSSDPPPSNVVPLKRD